MKCLIWICMFTNKNGYTPTRCNALIRVTIIAFDLNEFLTFVHMFYINCEFSTMYIHEMISLSIFFHKHILRNKSWLKCYYAFFLVCCGCDTPFIVSDHIHCQASICNFVVSRTLMAGAAIQAGDAYSSWAPGLTSGLQGSVNVHLGALLLVPQRQCISSFVFYYGCEFRRLNFHEVY